MSKSVDRLVEALLNESIEEYEGYTLQSIGPTEVRISKNGAFVWTQRSADAMAAAKRWVDENAGEDGIDSDKSEFSAEELQNELQGLMTDAGWNAHTFADRGVLTRDKGLIVRVDGKEFQVTITER